ncbi:M15 family metallopeptidase [Lactococcus insecticola]|uniref:D-alanyl-D-alanine carboxypeptidase-like core domain-containing protein n=1 Tax=Pseudolactococcus insecticola TaxID=2709158 RepID=A0A6A0B5B1_9LACT|nr:M15 family metallopeptidase [Lactococcus insecticola]GFH39678.1 hypothetical protein Hs20B_00760 [Lactococcus insecticola]
MPSDYSQKPRRNRSKKPRYDRIIFVLLILIVLILGGVFLGRALTKDKSAQATKTVGTSLTTPQKAKSSEVKSSSTKSKKSQKASGLPDSKSSDWQLVLVNRTHIKEEMNPDLTQIGSIYVDSRIAKNVTQFLAAAQAIDPSEHLISGYRSVAYQKQLFQQYVDQEIAAGNATTQAEAEKIVKTYSQPAGASEHETGLAIDMSTVDSLNESDPSVVSQLEKIAPDYGFVLRFPKGKSASTGVDYEDWHWRYVGVANAKYMTAHKLTLEEYLALLG